MVWRTPSSLKWLIVKRSRMSGALIALEAEKERMLGRLPTIDSQIDILRRQLAGLDQTFGLHEIQMDPEDIRPVESRRRRLMPHGFLGRAILGELRQAGDWLSSTEILARLAYRIDPDQSDYHQIRKCLRRRLGKLARDGILERRVCLSAKGRHDGRSETFFRIADIQPRTEISEPAEP